MTPVPVIVTQRRPECSDREHDEIIYREAFATLGYVNLRRSTGLARALADAGTSLDDVLGDLRLKRRATLPNRDVIEVEATTYEKLYDALTPAQRPGLRAGSGIDCTIWLDGSVADYRWGLKILAAWNAEHGIGIGERA